MADWKEEHETTRFPKLEDWVMHFDGSKQLHGLEDGVTLKSPKGDELSCMFQIHFPTTNNIAEYEALLHGLRVAKEIGVKHIMCCRDSDLVAQRVAGTYKDWNKIMASYRDEVDKMYKSFITYDIKYVRREDNMAADTLSKLGSSKAFLLGMFSRAPTHTICQDGGSRKSGVSEFSSHGGNACQSSMGRTLPGISDDQKVT
jgi:ribonuclease HI